MNSPTIVFLDASTLDRGDLDWNPLHKLGKVTLHPISTPTQIRERTATAEIVLTNKAVLDATVLANAPHLRMISVVATGTNNVDLVAAKKHNICVANVVGYGSASVAQHAMAFILNWATQMHRYVQEPKTWSKSPHFTRLDHPIIELAGKTLGLVGTGKIGSQLGRMAEAFGMKVLAWAREGATASKDTWPRLPLRELFQASDVVSLHCPLTDQTRHIINRESLAWMKSGSLLVNAGRGDLVDEAALIEALKSGKLAGAGLDVLSVEPPPPDHALLQYKHPNLMITPHSAWTTFEARARLLKESVANIEAFLKGESRNRVA